MDAQKPQFLEVGATGNSRRIAYRLREGEPGKPGLLWLPGFLSDMASTKAITVATWAAARGHAVLRFDYSGHGLSGGDLHDATIGDWLEETIAVWGLMGKDPRIAIGSSMGGWIALLLARHLAEQGRGGELAGLILIAPAWDMTDTLMWRAFPESRRAEIEAKGVTYLPSAYGDPYPVTKRLIEEGRSHLFAGHGFDPGCPVRILHGKRDPDVPWPHALALLYLLTGDDIELILVKSAEHRHSRPEDLRRLTATIEALTEKAGSALRA